MAKDIPELLMNNINSQKQAAEKSQTEKIKKQLTPGHFKAKLQKKKKKRKRPKKLQRQ